MCCACRLTPTQGRSCATAGHDARRHCMMTEMAKGFAATAGRGPRGCAPAHGHVYRHVYRHACGHVYRHAYRHVYGNISAHVYRKCVWTCVYTLEFGGRTCCLMWHAHSCTHLYMTHLWVRLLMAQCTRPYTCPYMSTLRQNLGPDARGRVQCDRLAMWACVRTCVWTGV